MNEDPIDLVVFDTLVPANLEEDVLKKIIYCHWFYMVSRFGRALCLSTAELGEELVDKLDLNVPEFYGYRINESQIKKIEDSGKMWNMEKDGEFYV